MNHNNFKTRTVALATLGVLGVGALMQPAPAQASSKEKLYKGGAVALGVLGAYYIVKGKTVPGAIAGAGAYYAYKKGKDANDDDDYNYNNRRYENRNSRNDYPRYDNRNRDYRNNDYRNNDYRNRDNNRYPDYSLR